MMIRDSGFGLLFGPPCTVALTIKSIVDNNAYRLLM